ncbi:hypothetical protein NL676_000072 [Syzygium grande]|nr:hypothetical protein NL676_000072 [Syzygium grande]
MAAVSRSIGNRVSPQTQIWSWKSTPSASVTLFRRNGHSSEREMNPEDVATVYEKNPHDTVPQNVVPDEVI